MSDFYSYEQQVTEMTRRLTPFNGNPHLPLNPMADTALLNESVCLVSSLSASKRLKFFKLLKTLVSSCNKCKPTYDILKTSGHLRDQNLKHGVPQDNQLLVAWFEMHQRHKDDFMIVEADGCSQRLQDDAYAKLVQDLEAFKKKNHSRSPFRKFWKSSSALKSDSDELSQHSCSMFELPPPEDSTDGSISPPVGSAVNDHSLRKVFSRLRHKKEDGFRDSIVFELKYLVEHGVTELFRSENRGPFFRKLGAKISKKSQDDLVNFEKLHRMSTSERDAMIAKVSPLATAADGVASRRETGFTDDDGPPKAKSAARFAAEEADFSWVSYSSSVTTITSVRDSESGQNSRIELYNTLSDCDSCDVTNGFGGIVLDEEGQQALCKLREGSIMADELRSDEISLGYESPTPDQGPELSGPPTKRAKKVYNMRPPGTDGFSHSFESHADLQRRISYDFEVETLIDYDSGDCSKLTSKGSDPDSKDFSVSEIGQLVLPSTAAYDVQTRVLVQVGMVYTEPEDTVIPVTVTEARETEQLAEALLSLRPAKPLRKPLIDHVASPESNKTKDTGDVSLLSVGPDKDFDFDWSQTMKWLFNPSSHRKRPRRKSNKKRRSKKQKIGAGKSNSDVVVAAEKVETVDSKDEPDHEFGSLGSSEIHPRRNGTQQEFSSIFEEAFTNPQGFYQLGAGNIHLPYSDEVDATANLFSNELCKSTAATELSDSCPVATGGNMGLGDTAISSEDCCKIAVVLPGSFATDVKLKDKIVQFFADISEACQVETSGFKSPCSL